MIEEWSRMIKVSQKWHHHHQSTSTYPSVTWFDGYLEVSWGFPKIIHLSFGFSIKINHPAIGVSPFMEPPHLMVEETWYITTWLPEEVLHTLMRRGRVSVLVVAVVDDARSIGTAWPGSQLIKWNNSLALQGGAPVREISWGSHNSHFTNWFMADITN